MSPIFSVMALITDVLLPQCRWDTVGLSVRCAPRQKTQDVSNVMECAFEITRKLTRWLSTGRQSSKVRDLDGMGRKGFPEARLVDEAESGGVASNLGWRGRHRKGETG